MQTVCFFTQTGSLSVIDGRLGHCIGFMWVIEFQKRGLPHAHILLTFSHLHKMRTAGDYDLLVSAEFPNPTTHAEEFECIKKFNVHGPCGYTRTITITITITIPITPCTLFFVS
jgi:hypothetical protein